jgi:sugar diacid utilization regulator/GAF domain-containing protein
MGLEAVPASRSGVRDSTAVGGYPDVIRAFSEIAEAVNQGTDRDRLLHMVAARMTQLLGIRRCSVYLQDERTGLFRGQVGETGRDEDAAIRRGVAGLEADGFTREILATRRPVLIKDAQSDPRPVRSTMRAWGIRTMLGVPMILGEEVIGLLFLDNEQVPHDYTESEQEVAAAFANLAAAAISHAAVCTELRSSASTLVRRQELLRRASEFEDQLTELVIRGADISEIVQTVASQIGKPATVYDSEFRRVAQARDERGSDRAIAPTLPRRTWEDPTVQRALADLQHRRTKTIGPLPEAGIMRRLVIADIAFGGTPWGYLVVEENGLRLSELDVRVARRAAMVIALVLAAEQRVADVRRHAQEALTRDLLQGAESVVALRRRADIHGLRLDRPHVVLYFVATEDALSVSPQAVAAALGAVLPGFKPFVASIEHGAAAIVELPWDEPVPVAISRMKRTAVAALGKIGAPAGSVFVGLSSLCRSCEDFNHGLRIAKQVGKCLLSFAADTEILVLAADDLGAARLLLSLSDRREADQFVEDAIGALFDDSLPAVSDLMLTLQAFFDSARSVRRAADRLGVHENTIRYRLARVAELTGLSVASDSADQMTTQLALVILQLEGRLPTLAAIREKDCSESRIDHGRPDLDEVVSDPPRRGHAVIQTAPGMLAAVSNGSGHSRFRAG